MAYSRSFSKAILVVAMVADKVQLGQFEFIPAKLIAEYLDIARPTLVKILQSLTKAGILESREGTKGGVRLARSPEEISVLDLLDALEQKRPLFQTDFRINVSGKKPDKAQEMVASILTEAEQQMKKRLAQTSMADLLRLMNA